MTFDADEGVTYRIAVDGQGAGHGTFALNGSFTPTEDAGDAGVEEEDGAENAGDAPDPAAVATSGTQSAVAPRGDRGEAVRDTTAPALRAAVRRQG